MAESFIQVAVDGSGKQIDTFVPVSTHRQVVVLGDSASASVMVLKAASTPAAATDTAVVVSMAAANSAVRIGDGTNYGAIKAASTAAAATDAAQVVSFAGANCATKIGDGTNNAVIKAASTAAAAADPSLVVNISPNSPAHPVTVSSGTITTVSAITAGPAIAAGFYSRITDGTSMSAVKAASTAAAAADPGLVVNISPNSPQPLTTSATQACISVNVNATGVLAAVKASGGNLMGFSFLNNTASPVFLEFWNVVTGSVTLGTTAPTCVFALPASGALTVSPADFALLNSGTGISFAAVTAYNGSTTASVTGSIFYK
jgi:hypothetical protein